MRMSDRLIRLIEPVVTGLGYELVGVEFDSNQRVLRIYIDREGGILIDDCSRVSHQVSGVLDVEDPISGRYQLEVSSPGMDRPLFTIEHFERFSGELARLQLLQPLAGRRRFKAVLAGVSDGKVVLIDGEERLEIPFEFIDKARLVPDFDKDLKG